MKKLLTSIFVLSALVANAQNVPSPFSKGSKYVTGKLGYTYKDLKDAKETSHKFEFAPGMGYFIADHMAVGASLKYIGSSINHKLENTKETTNTFAVEPFARKYFSVGSQSFLPYAQLDASLGWMNRKVSNVKSDTKFVWGASLRPGFSYVLSSRVALDASIGSLGYRDNTNEILTKERGKTYSFGLDLSDVKFGVQVFL